MNEDAKVLFDLCLRIADNNLVAGQRICEWCGHGPFLEEDIALSNIGLDMLGQANYFYQYASELEGGNRTVDTLAFLRAEREYKNDLITELPNGDYAFTMVKLYFYSEFQLLLYTLLQKCHDKRMKAMAEKAIKEVTYHVRHCKSWVVRFSNGTSESKHKLDKALGEVWGFTQELFDQRPEEVEGLSQIGIGPIKDLKKKWHEAVSEVLEKEKMVDLENVFQQRGRLKGIHTEHMGYLLAEMQYMQRTYPDCEW